MKQFLSFLFVAFLTGFPVYAQEAAPPQQQQQEQQQGGVPTGRLEELVSTLENEARRSEFIENLKTLIETQKQQEADAAEEVGSLIGSTGLGALIQDIRDTYQTTLSEWGIESSYVGKAGVMLVILLAGIGIGFLWRHFCLILRNKTVSLQERFHLRHERLRAYMRGVRYLGYFFILLAVLYGFGFTWDITIEDYLGGRALWLSFLSYILSITVIIAIAVLLWETINGVIEYTLYKSSDYKRSSRIRTILPIARTVMTVVLGILFLLVLLSQIGINILPLLAGAGVIGIAIGFGAQQIVKDFLTGFTILMEDLVHVGDVVNIAGKSGLVEKITIRKIQLRDMAATVYTIPFSEVTIIENLTKDFSYYVMDIGVSYRENTDEVIGYLKEIDDEMRQEEPYKDLMIEPIEILGVDRFADSAVIIKARLKTLPIQQWTVGREFNRRMKMKFDRMDVEIPFPHTTLYFGENKKGKAPPAPVKIIGDKTKKA